MKSVILFLWAIWDPVYYAFTRLRRIGRRGSERNVFRVRLTRYKGKSVWLCDGTWIRKNDLLLRIHLHNVLLFKELLPLQNDIKKGKHLYRLVRSSLPGLADYLRDHPRSEEIKAVVGITSLNRGSGSLGFETYLITNLFYRLYKRFTLLPIYLLFTEKPVQTLHKNAPAYLFMAKQKLLDNYLDAPV